MYNKNFNVNITGIYLFIVKIIKSFKTNKHPGLDFIVNLVYNKHISVWEINYGEL